MINLFKYLFGKNVEFDFSLNEAKDGLIVNGINNSSVIEEKVIIPSKVRFNGKVYSVTEIGENAFCYGKMTGFIIPESVTAIGKRAFAGCSELRCVVIPDSIKMIKKSTFSHCEKLSDVIIGKSILEIESEAFAFCKSLTRIEIPNTVKTIGDYAFSGSSLTYITIPNSVSSIGKYAFAFCRKLTEVEVGNSLTVIPHGAFYGCEVLKKSSNNQFC